jgi:hypothetical protein
VKIYSKVSTEGHTHLAKHGIMSAAGKARQDKDGAEADDVGADL